MLIKKLENIKFLPAVLLAVIILLQSVNICRIFVNDKKSFYCDEVFSFGLANSFYQPFIESDSVRSQELHYVDEWFSGEVYRNYITVQDSQRFRYDSVWYNQSQDRHPPLFYAVLHTVCSFFPDTFSKWFGFIPNLIYFAVTQIFLYRLAKNLLKSKYYALLLCSFFGFAPATVQNTMFIRMYCMLVMWTVIFMYLHSRLANFESGNFAKDFLPIMIVTALGSLTQYLFLFVAFVTAVCFCLWYLLQKKFGIFLKYSLSMLSGVVLFFAVYPVAFRHLFLEASSPQRRFAEQFVIAVRYVFQNNLAMAEADAVWLSVFIPQILLLLLVLSAPLLFLFRKDLKKLFPKIKRFFEKVRSFFKTRHSVFSSKNFPVVMSMLFSVAMILVIVPYTVSFMDFFAERYLYIISPFVILLVLGALYKLLSKVPAGKIPALILTVLLSYNVISRMYMPKAWKSENPVDMDSMFNQNNVVVILHDKSNYDVLSTAACDLFHAGNVFFANCCDIKDDLPKINSLHSDKPTYILILPEYESYENSDYVENILSEYDYIETYMFINYYFLIYRSK